MPFHLPIQDPVLVFTLILLIILVAPIFLHRIRVPSVIGLILAGIVVGPHGLNLLERNSAVVLFGTVGLLYIMFLAGLEIDLGEFRKNKNKSIGFGFYTFAIPMLLGWGVFYYALGYSFISSVLTASMFASHTLITYPIVTKLGISKLRAVNITIGGTLIVNLAALLILAVVVGSATGQVDMWFWLRLVGSLAVFSVVVLGIFPLVSRWFFKNESDAVAQFIFVLSVVFVSAWLAQVAGVESIIGAFLAGFALNRLIARNSPLMSRIEFVGNALFIPFFLIGVGMLVNYRVLFGETRSLLIALVMSVLATAAKYLAALATRKTFGLKANEGLLIFGLSNSQAASTLAAVLIGYNIVLGQDAAGNPQRLLDEHILNGTILMILFTCTVASFATQRAGISLAKEKLNPNDLGHSHAPETTLVGLANESTVDGLVELTINTKNRQNNFELFGVHVITSERESPEALQYARKLSQRAEQFAASADFRLKALIRYDLNIAAGIVNTIKEKNARHFFIGLHEKASLLDSFFGHLTNELLTRNQSALYIYKACQPLNTIRHFLLFVAENAELEPGFSEWYNKMLYLAQNNGNAVQVYAPTTTLRFLQSLPNKPADMQFRSIENYDQLVEMYAKITPNTLLAVNMARISGISYHPSMLHVHQLLSRERQKQSFLLVYPNNYQATGEVEAYTSPHLQQNLRSMKNRVSRLIRRPADRGENGPAATI